MEDERWLTEHSRSPTQPSTSLDDASRDSNKLHRSENPANLRICIVPHTEWARSVKHDAVLSRLTKEGRWGVQLHLWWQVLTLYTSIR